MKISDFDDPQIEKEAAAWFATMRSGDITESVKNSFEAWLHDDRRHKIAYSEIEQIYSDLGHIIVHAGLDLGGPSQDKSWFHNLVSIPKPKLANLYGSMIAFGLICCLALFSWNWSGQVQTSQPTTKYETAAAQIEVLTLSDGSVVTLGPKSRFRETFDDDKRLVTLEDGEAFFEVTSHDQRPFFVSAQDTLVRVVGTKFEVKKSAGVVHVSVLEGEVEVLKVERTGMQTKIEGRDSIDAQVLTAGQRISAARRVQLPQAKEVGRAEPGAWRNGRLTYEDASLAEIVSDLNRYFDRPIRLDDQSTGDLRLTLAINVSEIDQIFDVLSAVHPIDIDTTTADEVFIRYDG